MRELKELELPQLVEARKKAGSMPSSPMESPVIPSSPQFSQASTMSDLPSPTFSARGLNQMQTSIPSLPSSPTMIDSEIFGSGKRPLTYVKEEPQERDEDEDYDMLNSCSPDEGMVEPYFHPRLPEEEWSLDVPEVLRMLEKDLKDGDTEFPRNPNPKRQRPDIAPLSGLASKMSSRMPSFKGKWRSRKPSPSVTIPPMSREASVSRANSMRAQSISSAHGTGTQPPPTPAASVREQSSNNNNDYGFSSFSQVQEFDSSQQDGVDAYDHDAPKPATPLLPPLMTEHLRRTEVESSCQSPLQSPSVAADPTGDSSVLNSPISALPPTPQIGYPSPPLSTKPSVASFHHHRPYPTSSSEIIPPLHIPPVQDKWADLLGHANYTITPEPYVPDLITLETCTTLRADWDLARGNYAKHLMRVGDNTGCTSTIYSLTQEKWAETDARWKRNVDACVDQLNTEPPLSLTQSHSPTPATTAQSPLVLNTASTTSTTHSTAGGATQSFSSPPSSPPSLSPTATTIPLPSSHGPSLSAPPPQISPQRHTPGEPIGRDLAKTPPLVKIPALNGPNSEGKFPGVGDEGIVGMMEVGPTRVGALEREREKAEKERERVREKAERGERKRKWGGFIRDWVLGIKG